MLEDWLETPLFERSARRVTLTKEGRALLKSVDGAFARIRTASQRLRSARAEQQRLRVSALPFFTSTWLIPRLADFERAHPDIALEIDTSNALADFRSDKVDIAIRNVRRAPTGLLARKLLDTRLIPVCAPKLLDSPRPLRTPRDLSHHTLISTSVRPDSWSRWLTAAGCGDLRPRKVLTFDTIPAGLEAAARGAGVALAMDPLFWASPFARELICPFAVNVSGDASYYLVCRKTDAKRPALRAFLGWIEREMALFARSILTDPQRKRVLAGNDDRTRPRRSARLR